MAYAITFDEMNEQNGEQTMNETTIRINQEVVISDPESRYNEIVVKVDNIGEKNGFEIFGYIHPDSGNRHWEYTDAILYTI